MGDDDILDFTIDDKHQFVAATLTRELLHDNVEKKTVAELDRKLANAKIKERTELEQTTGFVAEQQRNRAGELYDYKRKRVISHMYKQAGIDKGKKPIKGYQIRNMIKIGVHMLFGEHMNQLRQDDYFAEIGTKFGNLKRMFAIVYDKVNADNRKLVSKERLSTTKLAKIAIEALYDELVKVFKTTDLWRRFARFRAKHTTRQLIVKGTFHACLAALVILYFRPSIVMLFSLVVLVVSLEIYN